MTTGSSEDQEGARIVEAPSGSLPLGHRVICGNFDMGTWFGQVTCVHGHPARLFNIERHHFVACDECRMFVHVGSNLMRNWRQENADRWEKNWQSVEGYGQAT